MSIRDIFVDDYEHRDTTIEYILENILQENDDKELEELKKDFYSSIVKNCECKKYCDDDACGHGANYEIKNNQLILRETRGCKDLIYECNENCLCSQTCRNKLVQFGPVSGLEIKLFNEKGYGLITSKLIEKGTFVCEYAGEILTKKEAFRRDQINQQSNQMNYIFCLNEMSMENDGRIQTFIDPSRKGNIGRYINHSCDANCEILSVRVDSVIPKIAIFSKRDIQAYEEISFSYGEVDDKDKMKKLCLCKAQNCKLYLPNISFC